MCKEYFLKIVLSRVLVAASRMIIRRHPLLKVAKFVQKRQPLYSLKTRTTANYVYEFNAAVIFLQKEIPLYSLQLIGL